MIKVFIHLVTYNSSGTICAAIDSALAQHGVRPEEVIVHVTDNASVDGTVELLEHYGEQVTLEVNDENLGFSAAHNQGATRFLRSPADAFLVLNPDVVLANDCVFQMVRALEQGDRIGAVTPKLVRNSSTSRALVDAAGMYITPSLRHFDRGAEEPDTGQYEVPVFVFGGTGACLLLHRRCINDVTLVTPEPELFRVYPALLNGYEQRTPLFDEGFFAYREDADLAWRMQLLGWRTRYEPAAVAVHGRVVTPERRRSLPPLLNLLGVRNRFLLQLNNLSFLSASVCLSGLLMRNLLVIAGVLLRERSSLPAFSQLLVLWSRAVRRRRVLLSRVPASTSASLKRWFKPQPYVEDV